MWHWKDQTNSLEDVLEHSIIYSRGSQRINLGAQYLSLQSFDATVQCVLGALHI